METLVHIGTVKNGSIVLKQPIDGYEGCLATITLSSGSQAYGTALQVMVSKYLGIDERAFTTECRRKDLVYARQLSMYLMCELLRPHITLQAIGKLHGGRDHTTVLHAHSKINDSIFKRDTKVIKDVKALTVACKNMIKTA